MFLAANVTFTEDGEVDGLRWCLGLGWRILGVSIKGHKHKLVGSTGIIGKGKKRIAQWPVPNDENTETY